MGSKSKNIQKSLQGGAMFVSNFFDFDSTVLTSILRFWLWRYGFEAGFDSDYARF